MKALITLFMALVTSTPPKVEQHFKVCKGDLVKVAVIDTGFGFSDKGHEANLCNEGHKDFSKEKKMTKNYVTKHPIPVDTNGHGTNIAGIIDSYMRKGNVRYCIVIIKYYSDKQNGQQNLVASTRAIRHAAKLKVDFINYSGYGPEFSEYEYLAIKRFIDNGGTFVTSAGNDGKDVGLIQNYVYPGMADRRAIIVGNMCKNGVRCESSNYGTPVTRWEVGEDVEVYGIKMTGTSQATAVATGKLASENKKSCDIGF